MRCALRALTLIPIFLTVVLPQQRPNGVRAEPDLGQIYDNSIPAAGGERRREYSRPQKRETNVISQVAFTCDTARCFSCMSRLYEAIWPILSTIYKRPRNFTDDCDEESIDPSKVPIVNCPTVCVSMVEEPNIAGVRVRGYIRGCMNDVLIGGFNQTIVGWYRWLHRDSCRQYRKKELFMLPGPPTDESQIEVCTCYSDHCNGRAGAFASTLMFPVVIALILMLRLL